jgi:hypothetical protein
MKNYKLILQLVISCFFLNFAISTFAHEGFAIEGIFTHQVREYNTTNTFKMEVDGDRYHLLIGLPESTNFSDAEIGSDGVDVYEVMRKDTIHTPNGPMMRGTVSSGTIPSGDVFGSDAICQILWLAYASNKEISKDDLTVTNLIPTLVFKGEDHLPLWDMHVHATIGLGPGQMKLPPEIDFSAPNYLLMSKSEFPPGADLKASSIRGKYIAPLAAPFTNGYLIARYIVTDKTNFNGQLIPSKFQFFRFNPGFGAKTSSDLDMVNTYEGIVLKCSSLTKNGEFLPMIKPQSLIQDQRLMRPGGNWAVYNAPNGKWLSRKDNEFQMKLQTYLNHASGEGKSHIFLIRTFVFIMLFLISPSAFLTFWWVSRKK